MSTFLIWSKVHRMWWRAERQGYTPHLEEAGRYSRAEAGDIVTGSGIPGEQVAVHLPAADWWLARFTNPGTWEPQT